MGVCSSLLKMVKSVSNQNPFSLDAPEVLTHKDLSSITNTFPTSLATKTGVETITNKNLTSGTNTFPTTLLTTTTAQAATNKDLTSGTNTFPTTLLTTTTAQAATNKDLTSGTNTFPTTLLTTTTAQAATNKDLTSGTNTFPTTLLTTTGVQTATNKAFTNPTFTNTGTNYTATAFDGYMVAELTTNFSGPWASNVTNRTLQFIKIGTQVFVSFSQGSNAKTTGNSTAAKVVALTACLEPFRPSIPRVGICPVLNPGVAGGAHGLFSIDTAGILNFGTGNGSAPANFTATSSSVGVDDNITITYQL